MFYKNKELLAEYFNLVESPERFDQVRIDPLDNIKSNENMANRYIKTYESVKQYGDYNGIPTYMYVDELNNRKFHFIANIQGRNFIVGYLRYTIDGDGYISDSIWNHRNFKGFIYNIFTNYILKDYRYVESSYIHRKMGENFWEKLIQDSINKGYVVTALNKKSKDEIDISSVDEISEYYDVNDNTNWVFRIYSDK